MGTALQQRSCISCRAKASKATLLRFVCDTCGTVVADPKARKAGRGAYTCASPKCVRAAAEKGKFSRAFRRRVDTPPWDTLWLATGAADGIVGRRSPRPESHACKGGQQRLSSRPLEVGPLEGSEHDEN